MLLFSCDCCPRHIHFHISETVIRLIKTIISVLTTFPAAVVYNDCHTKTLAFFYLIHELHCGHNADKVVYFIKL